MGYPSDVWQQQMEKANLITYNNTHLFQKPIPVLDPDYTTTFTTRFRPIPLIDDYNPTYIDPDYGRDPYWDTELYNQDLLQFQYVLDDIDHYNRTVHENPPITHNKKTRALIENWQMNDGTNHQVFPNPLGTENPENSGESTPQSLLDEKQFQNVLITRDGEPDCIPLSTNINLKCKKRMLYFPMDFGELTIDGLIDTGALSSAIPEMDLRKIRLLSPQSVIREGPPPNFQIMVANGQLETPKSTIELKLKVGDIEFHEIFIVMEHLTGPIIGLMFLQRNHTVLDMRQGILNFPFFSMQLKTADHKYSNVLEPILNPTEITIPPNDRVLTRINSLLYPENAVTGILQPSDLLHEEGDIKFCPALVTLNDGSIMIPVNNFTDHPYKLKKGLHTANFSVMTPEQMKYVKPVDPASTWHLLQNDQEQAAHYVSSLSKTNRNPQNSENYWFPTPENPGNPEEHTPIQKRILRELQALQDLETLDPTKDEESRAKFLEHFDWNDSTLTPEEKEKIEDLLVDFHDIFARHRFDIGMHERGIQEEIDT